jgi:AraC family transcriptional regulator
MIATKTKPVTENSAGSSALKQKLDHLDTPIFSSELMNWRGFGISKHRLPPGKSPERRAGGHYVVVQLNNSVKMDIEMSDGQHYNGRFFKGDVSYSPPGIACRAAWEQEREVLVISLDSSFVAARAGKDWPAGSLNFAPQFRVRDPLAEGIAQALGTEVSKQSARSANDPRLLAAANTDYANSLAEVLASHIIKDFTTPGAPVDRLKTGKLAPVKLRRATEFIVENIEAGVTLAEIAESVEMSPFHFARMFKQTTGFTPLQYVMEKKIEYSKSLLRNAELPLADIAFKLGFASQSHFTLHFRKLTGTTPKHFRDASPMVLS